MRLGVRGLYTLWTIVLAANVAAAVLVAVGDAGDFGVRAALSLLVGFSFSLTGLVVWWRRPVNPAGVLMVAVGLTWDAVALTAVDASVPFTVGTALQVLPFALFVHLLLVFPGGRLERALPLALAVVGYLEASVVWIAYLLVYDFRSGCDCPPNALQVWSSDVAADAIATAYRTIGIVGLLVLTGLLVRRWRTASAPARRVLAPVLATGGVAGASLVVALVLEQLSADGAADACWLLVLAALASVPLGFLAGLLRGRLAQSAVAQLVVELSAVQASGELRDALGRALGDPLLRLAYWLPEMQGYVDARGRPIEVDPAEQSEGRVATLVERDGRRVAALVHDVSLLDQPELVDGVCAAAGLALENERLQAELRAHLESLRRSEERLRTLIDASPVAIFEFDLDTRVTVWNDAAEAIFGWKAGEVLGRPLPIIPADRAAEAGELRAGVRAGTPLANYETVRLRKDGSLVDVLISSAVVRDGSGAVVGHMGTAVDITERKRAEGELRRMEAKDRALLDALPDIMFRFDSSGTYLDLKAEKETALVLPRDELIGRTMREVLPPELAEPFMERVERVLDTGRMETHEYQLELGGEPRDFEARLVRSGEDEVLSIVRDITERKRGEEELNMLQAELRRRLDELQASRARIVEAGDAERRRLERNLHDGAQQRLVALSLALRLAQAKAREDPAAAEELLEGAAEELSQALAELRELARGIHPAILTDRGLAAALQALAERAPVPVRLEMAVDERLPGKVEAAAYYIVSEAIANVTKYARASVVSVSVSRENGRALVRVADDGVGGADPAAGSGLRGLADRVESLDGRLEIESPPRGGTTIRAEIPCP